MRLLRLIPPSLVLVCAVGATSAAEPTQAPKKLQPIVGQDVRHDLSPPLFLMHLKRDSEVVSSTHEPLPLPKATQPAGFASPPPAVEIENDDDAASPLSAPLTTMPPPLLTFDGVNNRNGVGPPDANGDVGPNHYVQWVNLSYAVWDKQGTLLYGPVNGNTIWGGFGGLCETRNNGDPIVLYDPLADRWVLSQLAFIDPSEYHQCIAISATPDPTGAWYRYDYLFSHTTLNDYPKFGVWPDGYYLAVNQFVGTNPRVFAGQGVMAFEREKMLQGLPAQSIYFNLFGVNPNLGGALPADLDGPVLPPPGAPNVFVEMDDDAFGWTPIDRLSLWNFHVDWTNPANSTFGVAGEPDTVIDVGAAGYPFDTNMCNYSSSCIPQPGTARKIDALSDRLMYRLVYRGWPGHESLTLNHTVDADGLDHAGVRWYELRRTGGPWSIFQAGTYAPDGLHRWMASAAMDGSGEFAIGYNVAHGTVSPTIRYAGRVRSDPPGTLPHAEATLIDGSGAQSNLNRWGDYSMLSVDPADDCTFWYTQEYISAASVSGWVTRVGSFRFPECTACALVGSASLTLDRQGSDVAASWTGAANATAYDLAFGSLSILRASSGDFGAATIGCGLNDVSGTGAPVFGPDPPPGDGTYYLLRPIGSGCRGNYDDGSPSQKAPRDPEIAAAPGTCP